MAWFHPRGARARDMEAQEVMGPITEAREANSGKVRVSVAKAKEAKSWDLARSTMGHGTRERGEQAHSSRGRTRGEHLPVQYGHPG